ncbi:uncharacterized protein LODBEIA_P34080 [Lodderomyces beijingensis]|uniref:SAGA-associated factor 11 n=1 Tax=Lodderomyces beijingensis TaxID=1775926 RepID=A0ABP0ZMQ3_9ASCO
MPGQVVASPYLGLAGLLATLHVSLRNPISHFSPFDVQYFPTMTDSEITYRSLAESLLQDMIRNQIRTQTLINYTNERAMQTQTVPSAETDSVVKQLNATDPTKDIFGQDKSKLKAAESSRYFSCENCGRKIAGGRFASHVNKCLERKRK